MGEETAPGEENHEYEDIGKLYFLHWGWGQQQGSEPLEDNDGIRVHRKSILQTPTDVSNPKYKEGKTGTLKWMKRYTDKLGTLDGYGTVWLCRVGVENTLSLEILSKRFPVTLEAGEFTSRREKDTHTFQQQKNRLFVMDM